MMTPKLKKYIRDNLHLVDNYKYKELYEGIGDVIDVVQRGSLTELLLSCAIKPDDYMTELPGCYLYDAPDIETYYISENITSIGPWSFCGCPLLTRVTIPEGVTRIGYGAFSECTSLTQLQIPYGVSCIEYATFSGCSSLKEITIPDSITKIEARAFSRCSSLYNIRFNGTKQQWENIYKASDAFSYLPTSQIHCIDGDTQLIE